MDLIYVASPYAGDVEQNVENAKEYCRYVMEQGGVPLPSHLLYPQMLDDSSPAERGLGTRMGLELLARCDGLWANVKNLLMKSRKPEPAQMQALAIKNLA